MGQTPGGQGEACTSSLPLVESHLLLWQKNLNWPINAHAETQIEASDLRSSPEALGPPFRGNKEEWFLQQIVFPRDLRRCHSFRSESLASPFRLHDGDDDDKYLSAARPTR